MTEKELKIKNKYLDDLDMICYHLGFTINQYETAAKNIKSIAYTILQIFFKDNDNVGYTKQYYKKIFNIFDDSVFQYCIFYEVKKNLVFCD